MANPRVTQFIFEAATLSNPNVRVTQFVFEIAALGVAPSIICNNPPSGVVGTTYSHNFPASGGTAPYTFSITSGALPNGVTLDSATGTASGTPTQSGTFNFTVTVTDHVSISASVPCSIVISPSGITVSPISGGGPPKFRGGCTKDNQWNACLEDEVYRLRHIEFPPKCPIPQRWMNLLPWDEDFGAIPYQAVPFNIIGSIPTPLSAAGDVLVCEGRVPYGYDGLLSGIFQTYYGSGFQNGSGDILWRIQINQRYVLGLSNNPFAMGNGQNPIPLTDGQILLSGQAFRYIVNVPNTSGGVVIPGSRIVCGLLGFFWPR